MWEGGKSRHCHHCGIGLVSKGDGGVSGLSRACRGGKGERERGEIASWGSTLQYIESVDLNNIRISSCSACE